MKADRRKKNFFSLMKCETSKMEVIYKWRYRILTQIFYEAQMIVFCRLNGLMFKMI